MTHLRRLALTVDEGDPGCFTWLIMESTGDAVVFDQEVAHAEGPEPSYQEALRQGFHALNDYSIQDPLNGPRVAGEDENADPVTEDLDGRPSHCR